MVFINGEIGLRESDLKGIVDVPSVSSDVERVLS
jgi:hypothetical protein